MHFRGNLAVRFCGKLSTALSVTALLGASSCRETSTPGEFVGPHVAWQVPINGGNADLNWAGVPAVSDGRFYFAEGANITALDASTGTRLWSTQIRNNPSSLTSKILARGSQIYFPDYPDVFGLDAATGKINWRFAPDSDASVAESAVDDRAMYIGTRDHKVYALDVNTGQPIWTRDVGAGWSMTGIVQGISLASDTVYVGVTRWLAPNGYLQSAVIVALNRADGRELWRYESAGDQHGIVATPVVADNKLIADDVIFGSVFAVDRFTGKELWRRAAVSGNYGPMDSPIISGDTAFVASADVRSYALDANTGNAIWAGLGHGASFNAGMPCGRYMFANGQGIDVFDRRDGKKVSSMLMSVGPQDAYPTSHFASDGKRVYITGHLYAWAIDC